MTDSGPTPRLCLDTASTTSGGLDKHQANVRGALERLDPKLLRKLAYRVEDLDLDDVSQSTVVTKPMPDDHARTQRQRRVPRHL